MHLDSSFLKGPAKIVGTFLGILVLLFFLGIISQAQSNVYTKWSATYSPGQYLGEPFPVATVGDGQGNTYVTGSIGVCYQSSTSGCQVSGSDSVTVKYDSHGQTLWRAFLYAVPKTDPSFGGATGTGFSIALDAQGNVYVLSGLFVPDKGTGPPTIATAKYSPSGVRQWVNYIASTYTPGQPADAGLVPIDEYWPTAMTVSPGGDVYTAFYHTNHNSPGASTANVVKYNTSGKQQWLKTISPTPYNLNNPEAMQLDANENLYVLVDSLENVNPFNPQHHVSDIFKYNSSGNLLTSFGADKLGTIMSATALAATIGPYTIPYVFPFHVDAQGNTYVGGGGSPNANGVQPRIVAKFKTDGTVDWLYTFGLPNNQDNNFVVGISDLAVSRAGDVFVAQNLNVNGGNAGSNGTDIIVNKFDSTGQLLWTTQYNGHADGTGFDQAVAIAVDYAGSSYVTGKSTGTVQTPVGVFDVLATIKYDTKGNRVWVERFQPNPAIQDGPPTALAVSGSDVFVTGVAAKSSQNPPEEWLTINYGQDALEANPIVLNFGSQTINTRSAPRTFTLTNITSTPFIIKTINYAGDIHLTDYCPDTVEPGASCQISVTFTPTTLGKRTGSITIRDTSPGNAISPETIQITGTGTP
jgi:hypothetical protein